MSRLNEYSKWDKIELSDDDLDDLPPTLDKDSMKKYNKAKRMQRDNEEEKQLEELKKRIEKAEKELRQMGEAGRNHIKGQELKEQLDADKAALEKLERTLMRRVNADKLITNEVYSKGVLSSTAAETEGYTHQAPKVDGNVDEAKFEEFVLKNSRVLEEYVELGKKEGTSGLKQSCNYILQHPEIILSSDAETFCMFHCLGLEMDGKTAEMKKAARQGQIISQALQLSKMLAVPQGKDTEGELVLNRRGTEDMMLKLQSDEDLQKTFYQQCDLFIARIQKRAIEKLDEEAQMASKRTEQNTTAKASSGSSPTAKARSGTKDGKSTGKDTDDAKPEDLRGKQIGPGGLDAQEVFDTLPEALQDAFIAKDMEALQKAFTELPPEQSQYHLKRCVMSGLWVVPGYGDVPDQNGRESDSD